MLYMYLCKFNMLVGVIEGFGVGLGEGNVGVFGVDILNCVWYCWIIEWRGVVLMMMCMGM